MTEAGDVGDVGSVPPARGAETSMPAGSRAWLDAALLSATLLRAMARRSIAPTTLRPSGRAADATPKSVFLEPTTSVRSAVLANVACQLATALSLSPSSRYMSGAVPVSGFQSLYPIWRAGATDSRKIEFSIWRSGAEKPTTRTWRTRVLLLIVAFPWEIGRAHV